MTGSMIRELCAAEPRSDDIANMRGTSRREDAAFWVLRLDAMPDHTKEGDGARFISRFTKSRQGTREETEPLE